MSCFCPVWTMDVAYKRCYSYTQEKSKASLATQTAGFLLCWGKGDPMSPNDMLRALADIWAACVIDYPAADHAEILRYIEALQGIVFGLRE